jgi:two-component system nitrogen regulation response regulator GlnG/two-component system response regulator HydG
VENVGKAPLRLCGEESRQVVLEAGDVVVIGEEIALMCVRVPPSLVRPDAFKIGEPDHNGIVGESDAVWSLRDELRFYAGRAAHVLVLGPSGAGKELCARAIHTMSTRAHGPFLARNAATLPAGIIDAELFGNAKNYPNAGMRERTGLIGEASGGTLFLDEIGELPEAQQAHLLRVLDGGEYHRLGDEHARRADVRLIAATNRPLESIKHDLAARFTLRVFVPGLNERREDVPVLARHLLRATAKDDAELSRRFFQGGEPRIEPALVAALIEHDYTTHVRELDGLLHASMATSRGERLDLTPAVTARIKARERAQSEDTGLPAEMGDKERSRIEQALEAAGGNVSVAWKILGLSSRDALNRLIKKHNLVVRRS